MKRLSLVLGVLTALAILLPVPATALPLPACTLCIVEVQTAGFSSEGEDYVIMSNQTSAVVDLTGVSLKYVSASGASSRTLGLSGQLGPGAFQAFVSSGLSEFNPAASSLGTLGLSSTGGSLLLLKTAGGSVLDEVGWGTATQAEGQPAAAPTKGQALARYAQDGVFQDTANNSLDFSATSHGCTTLNLNEIQPFSLDGDGNELVPSLEFAVTGDITTLRCPLQVNSALGYIDLHTALTTGDYLVATSLVDAQGQSMPLGLTEAANSLQRLLLSAYGDIIVTGGSLQQPNLQVGQTYALFGTSWKPTYSSTLGRDNELAATPLLPAASVTEEPVVADTPVTDEPPASLPLALSELFPNPAAPLTDENDEFIELYNPNDQPVSLVGYKLQTGTNYSYTYTFNEGSLEPHAYQAYTSDQTKVSLANTGGKARLVGVDGQVIAEAEAYTKAPEGETWALIDGVWQWTAQPTPGQANVLMAATSNEPPKAVKASTAKTTPAQASKKASTKTASGSGSSSSGTGGSSGNKSSSNGAGPPPVHGLILAGVGALAVGYAGYEYRTDLANLIHRLRRYRTTRRAARATAAG